MSMLLDQAPRFSSATALMRHYQKVKLKMAGLSARQIYALPSPERMSIGNLPIIEPPAPYVRHSVCYGKPFTVPDIIPDQTGLAPERVESLSADIRRVAIRRASDATVTIISSDTVWRRPATIIIAIAAAFKVDHIALVHQTRRKGATEIRQIAAAIMSQLTGYSLSEIGGALGGRDHSTILNAVRKYRLLVEDVLREDAARQVGST